ncbi:MAG: VCBS repeat-containing protein, partial [Cyclobacteriaceae bacterium]|nr:VCBS repeat-containing protein [Cyclobacteriaceae bacterium]
PIYRQLNGFLTLDDATILGYGSGAIRSTDNGASWSVQNGSQFLSSVVTADSINLFSYDGNLLTSNDKGVTWNSQSISGLPFADKIQVDNSNNIYFRASNNLYKVNSGETTASLIFGTAFVSDFIVVNDIILVVNGATLYRSDNGGSGFSPITIPNSNRVWAYLNGLDETIFVHNNSTGTFNTSVDGGATWQQRFLPDTKAQINDFIVTASNFGFASVNRSVSLKTTSNAVLPAAPSDLIITAYTYNAVQLEWKDNSSLETSFEIERSVGDNTSYDFIASSFSFEPLPNSPILSVVGTPGENNFFRIRAVNSGGGPYSNEVSIVLPDQCASSVPDNRSWTLTVTGDPGSTPSGPIVNSNALIKHSGTTGNTFTIDNYHLGINGVSTEFIASFNENCGETFVVSNQSDFANGNGVWDDVNKVLTLKWKSRDNDPVFEGTSTLMLNAMDPVPETPGLSVYSVSGTEALISWNQTGFESEYIIERATSSGGPYTALSPIPYPTVFIIDNSLSSGGTYYYRIQAKNAQGSSPFSPEESVTLTNGLFRPAQNILSQNFDTQQGGSWGDLDGDGWEDLVLVRSASNTGQALPPAFFRNLGATQLGQFEQIELSELSEETNGSVSINIFDFNNDGKLDVYVARAGIGVTDLLLLNLDNNWGFSKMEVPKTGEINAVRNAVGFDYDNDGFVDILSGRRDFNTTVVQPGDLLLRNISGTGLAEVTMTPMSALLNSSGSVNAVDYDDDGDQDVFVVNFSTSTPASHLFDNNGDGTFTKVTGSIFDTENLLLPSTSSWGDIDNDG